MREILFRGKRIDNGEFIVGHLISYEDGRARITPSHSDIFCYEKDTSIIQTIAHEVVPETVGQFTGLTDKNGKRIFEGDIVQNVDGYLFSAQYLFAVKFCNGNFCGDADGFVYISGEDFHFCEVIGNIYDNKSLLNDQEAGE